MSRLRASLRPVLTPVLVALALAGVGAAPLLLPDAGAAAPAAAAAHDSSAESAAPTQTAHEQRLTAQAREGATQAAAARARAAAEQRERERASRARRAQDPRAVARALLAELGQADQFSCLERLWVRESNWDHTATNPSSGAYGIPQSLPAAKMASAGADWRTNPATQVRWGVDYITQSYGSPCAAWRFWQANNWY
ncbi:MAG TPA: hypothetical protein VNU26_02825 [Mycobacteriales bacterium]|nr:hypothetical protein [Mycobacteriales bacterium]